MSAVPYLAAGVLIGAAVLIIGRLVAASLTLPAEQDSHPTTDLHAAALPVLTEQAASNPRLAGLLAEIEHGRQRRGPR